MDSLALWRLSTMSRPWYAAVPSTTSRATTSSAVTTDPQRLPRPSLASATASSSVRYGITVFTGPNASTSCGSVFPNGASQ